MPNIKGAKKRVKTSQKRNVSNSVFKASMRTAMKNVEKFVEANDKEKALQELQLAYKKLDKAVSKGVAHKNYAANQKSRLSQLVNTL